MTWVQVFAEACVQSAALRPTVPLALDCHRLAGGFSGQSRQIMEGLEERQDRGKQRRKLTAMPLNASRSNRQTIATLHIQPSQLIFPSLSAFFFFFFIIWKLAFLISKSQSALCPHCDSQERSEYLWARQKERLRIISSRPAGSRRKERENKERKGNVKKNTHTKNWPGRGSFGRVWKQWLAAQRMVLLLFFCSINIWAPACIYPHSLFMKRPGKNASGEEGGKAKARDSSNQSWFKWHWVTEPGVLWLTVQMRHRAVIKGPHWPSVNGQRDILKAAPLVKLATTLGSKFAQTNLSWFYTAAVCVRALPLCFTNLNTSWVKEQLDTFWRLTKTQMAFDLCSVHLSDHSG